MRPTILRRCARPIICARQRRARGHRFAPTTRKTRHAIAPEIPPGDIRARRAVSAWRNGARAKSFAACAPVGPGALALKGRGGDRTGGALSVVDARGAGTNKGCLAAGPRVGCRALARHLLQDSSACICMHLLDWLSHNPASNIVEQSVLPAL